MANSLLRKDSQDFVLFFTFFNAIRDLIVLVIVDGSSDFATFLNADLDMAIFCSEGRSFASLHDDTERESIDVQEGSIPSLRMR